MPWTKKHQQFEAVFRHLGVRLELDALTASTRARYEQLMQFYRGLDPTIFVDVLSTPLFNAIATKHPHGEFVALFAGALTQLTLYAYQAFADPEFLPIVGDPSREQCDKILLRHLAAGDIIAASSLRHRPNDPVRCNAAERLAECACLILYLHELAHVRGCHLDILSDELGISEYYEITAMALDERSSLLLRALELEADTLALANSLGIWRGLVSSSGAHDVEELNPTRLWKLSAELLFLVMSFNHRRVREHQRASHPSAVTRFLNLQFLWGRDGQNDPELISLRDQPDLSLVLWADRHRLPSQVLRSFDEPWDPTVVSEWEELRAQVSRLWPALERHQRRREERLATINRSAD